MKFMIDNNIEVPDRIDISYYPKSCHSQNYSVILDRFFRDAEFVTDHFDAQAVAQQKPAPFNGAKFAAAETQYNSDASRREDIADAWRLQASNVRGHKVKRTFVWLTKYNKSGQDCDDPVTGNIKGTEAGWPVPIEDYLP